jgi:hypothetical protein
LSAAWSRQHPAASLRTDIQHFGVDGPDQGLDRGVVQLSHIEVPAIEGRRYWQGYIRPRLL